MIMAKHRRFGTRDAKMRTTISPTEIARQVATASRGILSRLEELYGATSVEVTTVGELRDRVPALAIDSRATEAENVNIVREHARAQVGTSRLQQQRANARAFLVTHAEGTTVYRAES